MISFFKRIKFFYLLFFCFLFLNASKVLSSDILFENSIHEALKNSLELKAQNYKLAATKNSLEESGSSKDWTNSFTTTFKSDNKDSNSQGIFVNDDTTTSTISLSKNIFDGGEAYEKISIAKENIKLEQYNLNIIEQKIILNSIRAFLDVYSNQSVVSLRKKSLDRFKENVDATELKLQAGTVTPTTLAEAQSKLAKAQYDLILSEGNLEKAISKFKSITKFKVVPNKLSLPNSTFIPPDKKNKTVKIALENNLDIMVAKLKKNIAEKNVALKESDNRPTLNLEFFGKDSKSSLNTSSTDYQSYGVNLTFKTPLFYNSSSKASIKKFDNLSRASSVELSEKQRQVELSAISSYQNYKSAIAKTKASESEKKSSLLALNGIKKEAEFGIRTILDVLDAEVEFLNASTNLIQSQADEIFSIYQIKSILGSLSIKDINNDLDVKYDLIENKLDFNILDRRMFN
jgi:TolC family type I secretion outer membrane protein